MKSEAAPLFYASTFLVIVFLSVWPQGGHAGTMLVPTPVGDLRVPVISQQENRFLKTVKQERDNSCGSAALATLLTYHYGLPVEEKTIFRAMYEQGNQESIRRDGFSLLDLKRYLDQNGFRADGFRMPLDKLAEIGVPAIVLINDEGYRHFVVIKGIDPRYVLVGDPAKGTRAMPRARFERDWNGIVFVIRNKRSIGAAHFNAPEEWKLAAQAPLDQVLAREGIASFTLSLPGTYEY